MSKKRRGISKRTRFEVFKRDGFACQYCGAKAPDALMQVDHVSPVSKGGADEILNYVTACVDCNSGKSDRELDDQSILAKQRAQLEELAERRDQLQMMVTWRDGLRNLEEEKVQQLVSRKDSIHPGWSTNETGMAEIRRLLKKTPFDLALQAVDEAARQVVIGEDGKATEESVRGIGETIGRIATALVADRKDPGLRELYFIRGIARKRFDLVDWKALNLLKDARAAGVPIDELRRAALEARYWREFERWIENLMEGAS